MTRVPPEQAVATLLELAESWRQLTVTKQLTREQELRLNPIIASTVLWDAAMLEADEVTERAALETMRARRLILVADNPERLRNRNREPVRFVNRAARRAAGKRK